MYRPFDRETSFALRPAVRLVAALALLLTVGSAGAPAARAAERPDPDAPGLSTSQRLEALVRRVQLEQQDLKSMEAAFVQTKESELFVEAEEAHGHFSYVAPDRVRWEFDEPDPMSVVIADDVMTTWYRDLNRAERVQVEKYSEQVFQYLGATGSLDALLDYFKVTVRFPQNGTEPYRLDMEPRYKQIEKRLQAMSLWIDRASFVPVRLRYTDGAGDTTDYRFEEMDLNAEIPAERFELELPANVRVTNTRLGKSASP